MDIKMPKMQYKDYKFPHNPHNCSYSCQKNHGVHEYLQLVGASVEDLGRKPKSVTITGEFFGPRAYLDWRELEKVFEEEGAGTFFHPIYEIKNALMIDLKSNLEPREDYVSYTCVFTEDFPPQEVAALIVQVTDEVIPTSSSGTSSGKQLGTLRNGNSGDYVIELQNKLVGEDIQLPKFGVDGLFGSETESAVRSYQKKYSLSVDGIAGPETLGHMGIEYYGGAGTFGKTKAKKTYTVKLGDTILHIQNRTRVYWKDLCTINKLKSPYDIHEGDVLLLEV